MKLESLSYDLAVCSLNPTDPIPTWATTGDFFSITKSGVELSEELSIVCESSLVPRDVKAERDWRVLKVVGPLPFNLVGILASITAPLAEAKVSIFAISTFDTDYILVKEALLATAIEALKGAGFSVSSWARK